MSSQWVSLGPTCPEGHAGRPLSRNEVAAVEKLLRERGQELAYPLGETYWCECCHRAFHWELPEQ